MSRIRLLLRDPHRRQRGSILSALLIIVAMLAILIGALTTELSSSFMATRAQSARILDEATVNSAVELGLQNLQNSAPTPVCVRDSRGPWYVALNGRSAAVTPSCTAILPDVQANLGVGAFQADGVHESLSGFNDYIAGSAGGVVRAYLFGTSNLDWSINVGGSVTGPVGVQNDVSDWGHVDVLVPNSSSSATCGGHCVSLYDQSPGIAPKWKCDVTTGGPVIAAPGTEIAPPGSGLTPHFPAYSFVGDSAGTITVFDASSDGSCSPLAQAADQSGAPVVGSPLVFTSTLSTKQSETTSVAAIFLIASNSSGTWLEQWAYVEVSDGTRMLSPIFRWGLSVGGSAVVSNPSAAAPAIGSSISLLVAGHSGAMQMVSVGATSTKSGPSYSPSLGASAAVPSSVDRAPYWCRCPGGTLIGVGDSNGFLYLLNTGLAVVAVYDGQADGRPAINTTPVADASNDWYFGADNGYVYDVEIPASGTQMFEAARFGPGGPIRSSPVEGACGSERCLYFASTTSGAFFVQIGLSRTFDLRACVTAAQGSTSCTANPRLWARANVGLASVVGGTGIAVTGWSYYSP